MRFYVFLKINFLKTTYISTKVSSASWPPAYAPPPPAAVSVFRLNLSISPRRATVEVVDDTIDIVKRTRIPRQSAMKILGFLGFSRVSDF